MNIGPRPVGDGEPTFVLAEIASAHQGKSDQAIALAKNAQEAGADGVKFQLFRSSELVAPNDPRRSTFNQIELTPDEWEQILKETTALDIAILIEVFDRTSLELAERANVAAYKVHSTDMENPEFVRAVAATGRPVLFSTGGMGLRAVEAAISVARTEGNQNIMLLHGVQNFPTRVEDTHLRFIATLKHAFGLPVGFLDHVDGATAMATMLPALAVAFGASLVEKHVTLDRGDKGFDYESALEKKPFAQMVQLIRETEKAFGRHDLPSGASAERYHRLMRRAVLSSVSLPEGEPVQKSQLVFLRSETGLAPYEATRVLGRKPRQEIPAWEPLTEDLFE